MENERIKYIRSKYGITDLKNEYTESEILEAINSTALFFAYYIDTTTGNVRFWDKTVCAYISKDGCIWVKNILFSDEDMYIKSNQYISEFKNDGDDINENIIYGGLLFFDKEYDECLSIIKERVALVLKKEIAKYQDKIINLQGALEKVSL